MGWNKQSPRCPVHHSELVPVYVRGRLHDEKVPVLNKFRKRTNAKFYSVTDRAGYRLYVCASGHFIIPDREDNFSGPISIQIGPGGK